MRKPFCGISLIYAILSLYSCILRNLKHSLIFFLLPILYCAGIPAQIKVSYDPRPAKAMEFLTLDTTVVRIKYQMFQVNDVSKPEEKTENIMALQLGSRISKFSNYHILLADSLWNTLVQKKEIRSEAMNKTLPLRAKTLPIKIFKNYPEGKITTFDRIPFNTYRYVEDVVEAVWNLGSGIETVCGYKCKKATTTFYGRKYTAWYAPDIPISNGPWKLGGLPGLILKAEDDNGHYSFECIAIERPTWVEPIYSIDYKCFNINKEQFFKLQKRYYDNPAAQVENTGMIKSELPASIRKARPYNPIELND